MGKNSSFWDGFWGNNNNQETKSGNKVVSDHLIEQGYKLIKHKYIDEPGILDQFTVDCNESLKSSSTAIYIYEDRIALRRTDGCGNIVAPKRDSLSFDEIDNIVLQREGRKIGIRFSGEILFYFIAGTRYYYLGTDEHMRRKDIKLTEANQIYFDAEYNDLVDKHFETLMRIFRSYKEGVKYEEKQERRTPKSVTNATTYVNQSGDGTINISSYNEFNANTSLMNISQRILKEVDGQERDEMLRILHEVEQFIKKMQETGVISKKSESTIGKIGDHFKKHDWFYKEIVSIIGSAVIKFIFPSIP